MSTIKPDGNPRRVVGQVWRFGDCEVDELRRELRVRGSVVDLEAKPWEVLHQLLLHAGEVVTKEELLEVVWPGVMVVDGSLATAVSKLRKALGDEDLVLTLPRIGYRLSVPVQTTQSLPPTWPELHLTPGAGVPGREQWRLVKRLDLSPNSEVWLAEHPKTHDQRVFKFAPDPIRLRSLKREVTLARLLRESCGERQDFVRILEWNFERQPYFVESEFCGPNLAEWAESQGGLKNIPLEVRLRLLSAIARAVSDAHDLGVLHKDLKPRNILIANSANLENPQIKVADFGSASLLVPSRLGTLGITNLGFTHTENEDSLSGTVMYVAPEVVAGQSPTAASDVYALGVFLYQLVAGDFRKPLAPGWEAEISDPLIREDIGDAACGDPSRRIKTAADFGRRLDSLEQRRRAREAMARAEEHARVAVQKRAKARARLTWLAVAAIVSGAAVVAILSFNKTSVPAEPKIRTVAVLPFRNLGGDRSLDYLRYALPDEVATTLSHTRGIAVRPFAATSKYDQIDLDPQTAGRQMRVTNVVMGHFNREGDQLHITVEAIDVNNNQVVWRDRVNAPTQSMIATQVQMTLRVRGGLAPALGSSATDVSLMPKNEEAYLLFLRSVAVPMDRGPNEDGIRMLEQSVQLDPNYAPAWLALGRRYYTEDHYTNGKPGANKRFVVAAERALAADPNYVAAGASLVISRVESGDLLHGYREAQELVRRRPDSVEAHFALSYVLRYAGLLEEAATNCDKAFLIDAQTQTDGLRSCAMVFLLSGDYPRALNYLNIEPSSDFSRALLINKLVRQGKPNEALQLGLQYVPPWASFDVLLAQLQRKPPAEIRALAERAQPSDDPETNYLAATHLAYAGQTDAALTMLKEAIKGNYCSFPAIDSDPMLDSLRQRPEFAQVREEAIQCRNNFLAQRGN